MAHITPSETFPALEKLPFLHAVFLRRQPGIDVLTDRETALARLQSIHRHTATELGFSSQPFATAQQVHGHRVERVTPDSPFPVSGTDGLITNVPGLCLAIYVADCAAVYLADKQGRGIGLVHSGKKGTEQGIVPEAIARMKTEFGIEPADLVVQISPCIRPPHYEIDFASTIITQAANAGVLDVHDCGTCTASDPELYYSYRREMGRTGRLLALMALS